MTDSPRRILIITAIVLAVFVALAIAVCVQPAGAQTVAPQLAWIMPACKVGILSLRSASPTSPALSSTGLTTAR